MRAVRYIVPSNCQKRQGGTSSDQERPVLENV
jgi:hypothetical protein